MSNNIPNNEENSDEIETNVQIFSNKDEKLKFLGKLLNSDSSRAILLLLIEKEMTANEIADETKQSLSLVFHHLNKMMQADIVTISKTISNTKNQPMKYYAAKSGIIILPEKASQKAKQSKSFSNSIKAIMKFAGIGISGVVTWFSTLSLQGQNNYQDWGPSGVNFDQIIFSSIATGIVIIVLYWIIIKRKKELRIY